MLCSLRRSIDCDEDDVSRTDALSDFGAELNIPLDVDGLLIESFQIRLVERQVSLSPAGYELLINVADFEMDVWVPAGHRYCCESSNIASAHHSHDQSVVLKLVHDLAGFLVLNLPTFIPVAGFLWVSRDSSGRLRQLQHLNLNLFLLFYLRTILWGFWGFGVVVGVVVVVVVAAVVVVVA